MHTVLTLLRGSRAFKVHNQDSDYDYLKIVLPHPSQIIGLDSFSKDKLVVPNDTTIITLQQFLQYAIKGSFNSLEPIFFPDFCIIEYSNIGQELLKIKNQLHSVKLLNSLIKFADSCIHNIHNEPDKIGKRAYLALRAYWAASEYKHTGSLQYNWSSDYISELKRIRSLKTFDSETLRAFETLKTTINNCKQHESIRETPDFDYLNMWLVNITKEYLSCNTWAQRLK